MSPYFRYVLLLTLLQLCRLFTCAVAQPSPHALIAGDFADPSILRVAGRYYAIGTSSEWAPHFPVYTSTNLKNWKQTGYIFNQTPGWTMGSFWAPEYYVINHTYYVYYTARRKKDGLSYIGVATSKFPDHGFQDHGVLVAFGREAIDAFVFKDKGQLYITFKAYGLDNRPIELLAYKLSADGLHLEGEPFSLLKDEERTGMEGESILKKDGYYYLFYASGDCCGTGCSYNVRVARAKAFTGPYQKYPGNPLLKGNGIWTCTGHGTFVTAANGKTYYLHHAYAAGSNVFTGRQGMLAQLTWPHPGDWPRLTEQAVTGTASYNISTAFTTRNPPPYWQWDFRNAKPVIRQGKGKLVLSGTAKPGNLTGVAITVRPVSAHFEMSTTVINHNAALKGLVFYGDAQAAAGIGVAGNRVELWMVRDNKRTVLAADTLTGNQPVELKFTLQPDKTCQAFYRHPHTQWTALKSPAPLEVSFLPQWDRSPRPGLLFKGDSTSTAEFSSFRMINP